MRPKRVDANHREIAAALRQVGAVVLDTHSIAGLLDLLIFYRGNATLLEVKDGSKVKSAKKLTPAEEETIALVKSAGGRAEIVESVDDALRAIGAIS